MSNAIAINNLDHLITIIGEATYDVEWGYRSSLDAKADLCSDHLIKATGMNDFHTLQEMINTAKDGKAALEAKIIDHAASVYGECVRAQFTR